MRRLRDRYAEVLTFLAVGGTGYVVDVTAFNLFRGMAPLATLDPAVARTLAVALAMVVTFIGNKYLTWAGRPTEDARREVSLFVLFNVVGFAFSVVTLVISHDLLGLRSALADNVSANIVGMALGTAFRFWGYRRFVFTGEGRIGSIKPSKMARSDREIAPRYGYRRCSFQRVFPSGTRDSGRSD